ncbi:tetratricopeptide repeat protein [Rhizobium sp. ZPR3]|uniref:Tetratricopeptide repeat protein n=2 Tax=unclassified Rhizobium TaxID=2613769 RepID=A0AAU7SQP9_9HYPH
MGIETTLLEEQPVVGLMFQQASLLADGGRYDEAKRIYLAILAIDAGHFGALNDLGNLLERTNFCSAARLAYAEAVRCHPDNVIGRINFANSLITNGAFAEAGAELEVALLLAPDHPDVHRSLANLLQNLGDWDAAETHRQKSYRPIELTFQPYQGEGTPCRVLVLVSAIGGNIPTRVLLSDQLFDVTVLVVEGYDVARPLPAHDVVFNAIGDSDICLTALDAADRVLALTSAPIANPPYRIRPTDRISNANRLKSLPYIRTPRMSLIKRSQAAEQARLFGFPLLLRSPGYHTGRYFRKVDEATDLDTALTELPGEQLVAIEYLDARDTAGLARKYRVMMIGGELFPLHLAISRNWMVHYFTADMVDNQHYRDEEAAFLSDMPSAIGQRAMEALKSIQMSLGLDYGGVDFAVDANGDLLFFEANATMVIVPPPGASMWDYRRAATFRALEAASVMILGKMEPQERV